MSSDTARSDETISIWKKMLVTQMYGGLILKIDDSNVEVIDKQLMTDSYDEFANSLPENDCRYALWQLPETLANFLILWTPDSALIKSKMMYSYKYDAVRKSYQHNVSIIATNPSDISLDSLRSSFNGVSTRNI